MSFYKVSDRETLNKIFEFMKVRAKLLQQYKEFTALMQQKNYRLCDDLVNGIRYLGLGIRLENTHQIDESKWVILENKKEGYALLQPNINHTETYKRYTDHYPHQTLSYESAISLMISENLTPDRPDFSLTVLPDKFALVASTDYNPLPALEPISYQEYKNLISTEGSIELYH